MKNSPKAPDPYETARAQGAVNKETAITQAGLNMTNQYTPGGSLEYEQIGTWQDGTPRYSAKQTLSQDQQQLYDLSNRLQGMYGQTAESQLASVMGRLSQPFSTKGAAGGYPDPQANTNGPRPLGPRPSDPPVALSSPAPWPGYSPPPRQNVPTPGSEMVRTLDMSGLPGLASNASAGQGVRYGIGNAGPIQTGFADTGPIQTGFADTGSQMRTFGDVGSQQRTLDFSAFGDPNISRDRVESALMARLNPQLTQDRDALETKLANQGLTPGTQAYDQAIDSFNRQVNDARLGAIMNAGGEQSRVFGLGLQQGQFANAGQERDYAQELGRASFWNTGQAQDFGQAKERVGFANQAQAQQFDQNARKAAFWNAGQAQDFGQAKERAAFWNAGQAQDFGQAKERAGFANQAQAQQFDQNAKEAAFWNAAQDQDFGQSMANASLNNAARGQGINERLAGANFQNTARQNAISEAIQERQVPLNELAALLSGVQVQGPNFVNTPQTGVSGTDITGPIMQQYQQQMAQRNAMMGGLFGLGGAALAGGRFW